VHESDTIPGRANARAARGARIIELGFKEAEGYFPKTKAVFHVSGNPVRKEIASQGNCTPEERKALKTEFGFSPDAPVLLVVGGSQGAERLNTFMLEHLSVLTAQFQILHQTGSGNFEQYKKEYDFMVGRMDSTLLAARYKFFPFFDAVTMGKAYAASDLMLSRSGGSAIFEAAAIGTPAILVPLPEAAKNHQFQNAYAYHTRGAALFIEEDNFLINVFLNEAEKLLKNPEKMKSMQVAARAFYIDGGAALIAQDILSLV
jgi:UDP-N-acetylglucosamine--N-acetylmuramyl-(pentapeptide) pyrophosphoryl-undecaprenol N-acetylglucosamine transferase